MIFSKWLCLIFLLSGYGFFALALFKGSRAKWPVVKDGKLPSVSVIVPARNEEKNIVACMESLEQLDFPRELLQIVIVNHCSVDRTHEIISKFIHDKPHFTYVKIRNEPVKLSGKAAALSEGIKNSRGEIIFTTDADCIVPPGWLRSMVRFFVPDVGVVLGFTVVKIKKKIFFKLQAIDWLYLLSVGAGAIGIKKPLSWFGNNFAIRREVYDSVGGYEGIGFSLAEDFALFNAVSRLSKWKVAFSIDKNCLVITQPVEKFFDFISQRKRWAIGARDVPWFGKLMIVFSFFMHLFLIASFFTANFIFAATLFSSILIFDILLISEAAKKLQYRRLLLWLPFYKIFSFLYMLILAITLVFRRRVVWKGIQYQE